MKQHPRKTVGNATARPGKRETFMAHKAERDGLADVINNAMSNRRVKNHIDKRMEGVMPEVKPKRFSK